MPRGISSRARCGSLVGAPNRRSHVFAYAGRADRAASRRMSASIPTPFWTGEVQVVLVRPATGRPAAAPGPAASREAALQAAASLPTATPPATPPAPAESRSRALSTMGDGRRLVANLQTRTLSNGLTLIMLPLPGSPFHTALLGFRGGTAQATPPGVLVAARWGRWHETASPEEWGLLYGYELAADTTREVLQSTGSDVSLTLKLLGEQVNHETSWPPRRFLDLLGVFEREEQAPATLFVRAFDRAFFGNHPLASRPTANDIQHITAADVLTWIHRVRQPRNAALVIVGDFDPNQAARSAEQHFADWGESAEKLPEFSLPTSIERQPARSDDERLVVQDRAGTSSASVRLRCWLPPIKPDKLGAHGIFKEGIERELRERLRGELGASYSVSGRFTSLLGGGVYYEIDADADYERLAAALRVARGALSAAARRVRGRRAVRTAAVRSPTHQGPGHARRRSPTVPLLEHGLAARHRGSLRGASSPGPRRRGGSSR